MLKNIYKNSQRGRFQWTGIKNNWRQKGTYAYALHIGSYYSR